MAFVRKLRFRQGAKFGNDAAKKKNGGGRSLVRGGKNALKTFKKLRNA